jgi:hypothetical protein
MLDANYLKAFKGGNKQKVNYFHQDNRVYQPEAVILKKNKFH